MTIDTKEMRARAERWLRPANHVITRDNALGEDHMALDVLELLNENDSLRAEVESLRGINAESGEWIDSAAKLEIELRARVETFRNSMYALESQVTQLREQLSAALAAKDEACEIALQWAAHLRDLHGDPRDRTRIVELRSIGKDGGND